MNTRFKEKNLCSLLHSINTKKLVFIDRKKNQEYKKVYKDIIYKLDINDYRYSSFDDNKKYKGEKVHVFSYKNLYIKVKITKKVCKILSMHVARYEF